MPEGTKGESTLPSVIAISTGAMVGSGVLTLPRVTLGTAGSAVVLAYLFLCTPALTGTVSNSKMATATHDVGRKYPYVDRVESLLGTVPGIVLRFSLSFKSVLAPLGSAPYCLCLVSNPHTGGNG